MEKRVRGAEGGGWRVESKRAKREKVEGRKVWEWRV